MRLPDFLENDDFNRLRKQMGAGVLADELGGIAWTPLPVRGVDISDLAEITVEPDRTLSYRGRRILVFIRDQYLNADGTPRNYRYHVAECKKLQEMRRDKRFGRYVGADRDDGNFTVNYLSGGRIVRKEIERKLLVCRYCLGELDWDGYSRKPARVRDQIHQNFSPARFFKHYGKTLVAPPPLHTAETAPENVYPRNWKEISLTHRESARWICSSCGGNFSASHRKSQLHVHHIDGDRSNNLSNNLRVLCADCHAKQPGHQHLMRPSRGKSVPTARSTDHVSRSNPSSRRSKGTDHADRKPDTDRWNRSSQGDRRSRDLIPPF